MDRTTYRLMMHEDTVPSMELLSTDSLCVQQEGGYTVKILQWSYPVQDTEGDPRASAAVAEAKPTGVPGRGITARDFHSGGAVPMAFL